MWKGKTKVHFYKNLSCYVFAKYTEIVLGATTFLSLSKINSSVHIFVHKDSLRKCTLKQICHVHKTEPMADLLK